LQQQLADDERTRRFGPCLPWRGAGVMLHLACDLAIGDDDIVDGDGLRRSGVVYDGAHGLGREAK
jgi:hypothetical protein